MLHARLMLRQVEILSSGTSGDVSSSSCHVLRLSHALLGDLQWILARCRHCYLSSKEAGSFGLRHSQSAGSLTLLKASYIAGRWYKRAV